MTDHYKEVGLDDFLDSILDREERELFRREFGLIDDNEFHSGEDEPGTNETLSHSSGLSANSGEQSWLGKFGRRDKWSFCLTAVRMAAEQEKR